MNFDDLDEAKTYQAIRLGVRDAVADFFRTSIDPDLVTEAIRNGTSDAAADGLIRRD